MGQEDKYICILTPKERPLSATEQKRPAQGSQKSRKASVPKSRCILGGNTNNHGGYSKPVFRETLDAIKNEVKSLKRNIHNQEHRLQSLQEMMTDMGAEQHLSQEQS